jgi:REP element-mobilizing transposase RayT
MDAMATTIRALAYHITWTTYGTWLPGDRRGWCKKGHAGVKEPDWRVEDEARSRMAQGAVILTDSQRNSIDDTIRTHCVIRGWQLHAVNARTNHVHVVISADCEPDEVMNQLKARCSQRLSDDAGLTTPVAHKAGRRRWFTEGGDKEEIYDEEQLRNTIRYVLEGQ